MGLIGEGAPEKTLPYETGMRWRVSGGGRRPNWPLHCVHKDVHTNESTTTPLTLSDNDLNTKHHTLHGSVYMKYCNYIV